MQIWHIGLRVSYCKDDCIFWTNWRYPIYTCDLLYVIKLCIILENGRDFRLYTVQLSDGIPLNKKKIPFGKTTRCGSVKVGGVKRGSALVGWELEHVYVGVY